MQQINLSVFQFCVLSDGLSESSEKTVHIRANSWILTITFHGYDIFVLDKYYIEKLNKDKVQEKQTKKILRAKWYFAYTRSY